MRTSQEQDRRVGDGTTTVTLLAAELMRRVNGDARLVDGLRRACEWTCRQAGHEAIDWKSSEQQQKRLRQVICTALGAARDVHTVHLVDLCVQATTGGGGMLMPRVVRRAGGSVADSQLLRQTVVLDTAEVAVSQDGVDESDLPILVCRLSALERLHSEATVTVAEGTLSVAETERRVMLEVARRVAATGARVVVSHAPVHPLVQQALCAAGVTWCIGNTGFEYTESVAAVCGCRVVADVSQLTRERLGRARGLQWDREQRLVTLTGTTGQVDTLVLRAPSEALAEEMERCVTDALRAGLAVASATGRVVPGGGRLHARLGRRLLAWVAEHADHPHARACEVFATALECVPQTLAAAGDMSDATAEEEKETDQVLEPLAVFCCALRHATNLVCDLVRVDGNAMLPARKTARDLGLM